MLEDWLRLHLPIPEISGHPILNCSCLQSNSDDLGISHDSVYVYYSVESSGHNEMTREEQHGQDQGDLREEGNSRFLLAETREWPLPTGSGAEGGPGGSKGPGSL